MIISTRDWSIAELVADWYNDDRAISPAPRFYQSLLLEMKTVAVVLDRSYLADASLSLLTSLLASDSIYEEAEELPPFQLEWDCQGAIEEANDGTIHLSGAEIKSSKRGKYIPQSAATVHECQRPMTNPLCHQDSEMELTNFVADLASSCSSSAMFTQHPPGDRLSPRGGY